MEMKLFWVAVFVGFGLSRWVDGFEDLNVTEVSFVEEEAPKPLLVGLTLIQGAAAKEACMLQKISPFLPPFTLISIYFFFLFLSHLP